MFQRLSFLTAKNIRLSSYLPKPSLGRWEIHYDPKLTFQKVDWANEDHCGVCGFVYENSKIPTNDAYSIEMIGCFIEIT
jgi:hypothetical protein